MRWWTLYTEDRLISVVLKRRGGRVKVRVCLVLLVEDTSSFGKAVIMELLVLVCSLGMVVCNTFFKKEDSKLIIYQSGDNRNMIDYLMVRKTDRCLVKDVKVISSEECVPQQRMVIGRLLYP